MTASPSHHQGSRRAAQGRSTYNDMGTPLTFEAYLATLPAERREAMQHLRQTIVDHLPSGFAETIGTGSVGYAVPHTTYPAGYHCDPKQPLPFMSIASQKNFIAIYHMGLYGDPKLLAWFTGEYPKHCKTKLDMGKSCIRLKKMDQIPYDLIGELCTKVTVDDWISTYEQAIRRSV
jgi:hypothetical protein